MIIPTHFIEATNRILERHAKEVHLQYPDLMKALLEKPFLATDTGIHPKLMADWNRKGLLISPHTKNKRHSFSLSEFVWIKLVEKMRLYNFSYEFIRSFRKELVSYSEINLHDFFDNPNFIDSILKPFPDEIKPIIRAGIANPETRKQIMASIPVDINSVSKLDGLVLSCLVIKQPLSFLLDHNGMGTVFSPVMLEEPEIDQGLFYRMICQSHVTLSITEVLTEVLAIAPIEKISGKMQFITEEEAIVLKALSEENVVSLKIRVDNEGEVDFMEITKLETTDKRARIMEKMLSNGYQDITIKTANGNVIRCENTRKVKLK